MLSKAVRPRVRGSDGLARMRHMSGTEHVLRHRLDALL
jgi:hypothetical protein